MKKKSHTSGIVYSTDPNFQLDVEESEKEVSLSPHEQKLIVRMETKHRAGKTVTLIDGFQGNSTEKEELVKKLKNHCGTGGSAKDGEILIQGDHRDKVMQWLIKNGYQYSKKR